MEKIRDFQVDIGAFQAKFRELPVAAKERLEVLLKEEFSRNKVYRFMDYDSGYLDAHILFRTSVILNMTMNDILDPEIPLRDFREEIDEAQIAKKYGLSAA